MFVHPGEELRGLIFEKYGKYYDAEFAIRKFMGKDLVRSLRHWSACAVVCPEFEDLRTFH